MYIKPTKKMVKTGIEYGLTREQAERGYDIFDYDGTGMLEIERIDDIFYNTEVTDEACARQAEKDGFCKIIPIQELPKAMKDEGLYYFGWVDTPENRKAIEEYCKG